MIGIAESLLVFFGGGLICLATSWHPRLARIAGPCVTVAGCAFGMLPIGAALSGKCISGFRLPWSLPFGTMYVEMDALSAVFAAPILIIGAMAAIYGSAYLRPFEDRKNLAVSWFFFNLLIGSMLLVVLARNAMLFLLAWEIMSLASFFLVMFENEHENVRRAGWIYFVATHIGTAFLLVLFLLLGKGGGSLDFAGFLPTEGHIKSSTTLFILAVIGFGAKAGFIPMHVWLPEAHPAAPSHVSAVMSGVMIKTGIYGLLRVLIFLGAPPPWWGWTLAGIGAFSGILGILFALAQHDIKRLLAYSSVENIGIIALGLGVGMLGVSYDHPVMAFLGFSGSLLHVINHAVFKSLLFLGAGSVAHNCHTREIDQLGGLLKKMPVTALAFLVGSVAICGLPPLNGFLSEFMIYTGSLSALSQTSGVPIAGLGTSFIVLASLALIGGLATACFTKVFGIVFLGEPRSSHAAHAQETMTAMRIPMMTLAAICLIIGLSGPVTIQTLAPAAEQMTGCTVATTTAPAWIKDSLLMITLTVSGILALSALLALIRSRLIAGRNTSVAATWDCGYAAPTPRMQYTASSFVDPITLMFHFVLRTHRRIAPPSGLFPGKSSFASETPDVYRDRIYDPAFAAAERLFSRLRWIQHGRINIYILYIALALIALLAWKLR